MVIAMDRLSNLNAVSGAEDEARAYIIPMIKDKCDSIEVDSIGNIICCKKGKSQEHKILIGTNIDEVGFIVSDITEKGFVKFKTVGTIDSRTLVSKCVKIGTAGVCGVIGMKAIHLQTKDERDAAVKVKDLYIDIGATSKEEALKRVSLGDRIAFNTAFETKGKVIKGKALDRFGVIPLIEAMDVEPAYDTYYVLSTQREVPCSVMGRGMRVAAFKIKPDYALIINTVNSDDFYKSKSVSAKLGDGTVIECMDKSSIADIRFLTGLEKLATENNITTQRKTSTYGTSVAGAVQMASVGAVTASIAIPCRYSHSPVGYMNMDDINATSRLCCAFLKESDVIINGITETIN